MGPEPRDRAERDRRFLGLGWSAAEIRAAEQPLLAAGVPLMARAAAGLADEVRRVLRDRPGAVLALVGSGDNGGDVLFAAAHLARDGVRVDLALVGSGAHEAGMSAAAAAGARVLADSAPETVARATVAATVLLDGVLGIGAVGATALREPARAVVQAVVVALGSAPRRPAVIAADPPSGVGADDGAVPEVVLPADRTVVFGAMKAGLLFASSRAVRGEVVLVDIGLADSLRTVAARTRSPYGRVLDAASLRRLHPRLRAYSSRIPRGAVGVGEGRLDTVGAPGRLCRLLLVPMAPLRLLPSGHGRDVPFTVVNRPGRVRVRRGGGTAPAIRAIRTLALPDGRTFGLRDRIAVVGDRLVDDVGVGGVVRVVLRAEVDDAGGLVLTSTSVAVRLGPLMLRLPARIAPTLRLEERFEEAHGVLRMTLEFRMPGVGVVYGAAGAFRYRVLR